MEGVTPIRQWAPPESIQGTEEGGSTPLAATRAPHARPTEEGGGRKTPPEKEGEGMAPPNSAARYPHRAHGRERGGRPTTQRRDRRRVEIEEPDKEHLQLADARKDGRYREVETAHHPH